jgi:possible homing endonuclease
MIVDNQLIFGEMIMSDKVKKKYYHNGIVNKMYEEGKQPDGFVLGMLPRTKEKQDAINKKRVESTLNKYGVSHISRLNDVKAKKKKSLLEHYGVDNPSKSKVIQDKKKDTFLKKYGVDNPMKSEEVKSKFRDNYNAKYGVDNPFQLDVVKDKIKETNRENLGVDYPTQCQEVRDKVRDTFMERYGVPYTFMLSKEWLDANDSKPNRDFASLLDANNIKYEREFRCGKYSYDFKVVNTLIEINPTATHNTYFSPYGDKSVKGKYYHRDKSKLARDSGYNVIHVFDWDDKSKIINLLRDRDIVYARKCDVRLVDSVECNQYLMTYHLQDKCNSQTIRLGLYYNNQLVSLMTFGVARYNKKYEYELLRYCASHNVVGGANKLFKYFVDNYKPNSIISYCDTSKFSGKVYDMLGFKIDTVNVPSCHWYSVKENKHITDNLLRMQGYDRLFKENHGKGTSNEELILARGYLPVYDCGQATYIWRKS